MGNAPAGGVDWGALMRAGLCELRLTPVQFWALTPAELMLMTGRGAGSRALDRAGLEALVATFPDQERRMP